MSTAASPAVAAPAESGSSKLLANIIVLAIVLAVIAAEVLAAMLFLPSGDAPPPAPAAQAAPGLPGAPEEEKPIEESEQAEVDLGEFRVSSFQPSSNVTLRIDFHVFGTIHKSDADKVKELLEKHLHRVRDQVIVTVRSCEVADFTDPGLGLIKRRLLETTNRTLGEPVLRGVAFSTFSVAEQ